MRDIVFSAGECLLRRPMTARWAGGCAPPPQSSVTGSWEFQGDVSRRPFCVEITRKSVCVSDPDVQSCAQAWDGPGDCFSAWALPPSPSLWGSPLSPDALASGGGWPCGPSPHPRAAPPDLCPPRFPCFPVPTQVRRPLSWRCGLCCSPAHGAYSCVSSWPPDLVVTAAGNSATQSTAPLTLRWVSGFLEPAVPLLLAICLGARGAGRVLLSRCGLSEAAGTFPRLSSTGAVPRGSLEVLPSFSSRWRSGPVFVLPAHVRLRAAVGGGLPPGCPTVAGSLGLAPRVGLSRAPAC